MSTQAEIDAASKRNMASMKSLNSIVVTGGSGGSTVDREFIATQWKCTTAATGIAIGDLITQADEYDVTTNPSTYLSTTFRNVTQGTILASAPLVANLTLVSGSTTATLAAGSAVVGKVSLQTNASDVGSSNALATYVPDTTANGNITIINSIGTGVGTTGSYIGFTGLNGVGDCTFQVTGTYTGALTPQVTMDGTNWVSLGSTGLLNVTTGAYSATVASAAVGVYQVDISGFKNFRLVALAAVTGTAVITMSTSQSTGMIALDNPIPTGANTIGAVNINTGTNSIGVVSLATPTLATLTSAATTNATCAKASAGTLYTITYDNVTATIRYLKLYNLAVAPTVGTSVPILTIPLPVTSGQCIDLGSLGLRFSTGIAYAITGAMVYTDTTVIAAGDVHLGLSYV